MGAPGPARRAALDGGVAVVARFVYAARPNAPEYMVKGGAAWRLPASHLDSVRLVVDALSSALAPRIDCADWGRVTSDRHPGFQSFGFARGLCDRDTGLVRFGGRDYDPATGRSVPRGDFEACLGNVVREGTLR